MWTRAVVVAAASVHDHAIGSAPLDKVAAAARANPSVGRRIRPGQADHGMGRLVRSGRRGCVDLPGPGWRGPVFGEAGPKIVVVKTGTVRQTSW